MADERSGRRGGKKSRRGVENESSIGIVISAGLGGIESLYLATHSMIVTVLGAVLVAALTLMITRKNAR